MARILVVDDERAMVEMLGEMLTTAGHEVVLAGDLAQGFELMKNQPLDLALVDIGLPSGQQAGLELLQKIKKHKSSIAVIMITGAASQQRVVAALRGGAQDFLEKPFSTDELLKRVETVLAQQKALGRHERLLF